jgi:hypothetical protein
MPTKKPPTLTVIEGGKTDPASPELPPTLNFFTSLSSFMFTFVDASGENSSSVFVSTKRSVDGKSWGELADLVDRWRAAKDEFTLATLNQELQQWLDRK